MISCEVSFSRQTALSRGASSEHNCNDHQVLSLVVFVVFQANSLHLCMSSLELDNICRNKGINIDVGTAVVTVFQENVILLGPLKCRFLVADQARGQSVVAIEHPFFTVL